VIPRIRKILYATDLTKNSAYAFRYAINSAQKHDAQIYILHVLERLPPSIEGLIGLHIEESRLEELWKEKKGEQIRRIEKRLKEFADRELKSDPETLNRVADILVLEGDPVLEILRQVDALDCDVLIMGSHGRGIISHAFLGSVAQKVLQEIKKPVFFIPIPREDIDITFRDI
jgi:nucleotide-binding universal stress UspA family protein